VRNVIERVLNLLAFLLTTTKPATADEIRRTVAGYGGESDEAFRRMFERDKDLLRRLGIPIKTAPADRWQLEPGYVVSADEYRIPDPELDDEERAALWLAAQVVRIGGQPQGPDAILKLGGARTTTGVEPVGADLGADADLLASLYVATTERRLIDFTYRDRRRSLAPHGLGHRNGHWYVVGVEADSERVYRIDRMTGITVGDEEHAFERTPGLTVRGALARHPWETGAGAATTVTVRFDADVAWWAERRLEGRAGIRHTDGSVEVALEVNHLDAFLGWVLSFGEHAQVVDPPAVRDALVRRVEAVAV